MARLWILRYWHNCCRFWRPLYTFLQYIHLSPPSLKMYKRSQDSTMLAPLLLEYEACPEASTITQIYISWNLKVTRAGRNRKPYSKQEDRLSWQFPSHHLPQRVMFWRDNTVNIILCFRCKNHSFMMIKQSTHPNQNAMFYSKPLQCALGASCIFQVVC